MTNLSDLFPALPVVAEFVSATMVDYDTTGDVSVTIPVPEGIYLNDLMVIFGISRNSFIGEPEGSGWTPIFEVGVLNTGSVDDPLAANNDVCYGWYKRAGSSEPATYSFLINDDGTDGQIMHCMAFRNAVSAASYVVDGAKVAPTISVQTGDILLSLHGAAYSLDSISSVREPPGMALVQRNTNTTADCSLAVAYEKVFVSALSGTRTWISSWDGTDAVLSVNLRIQNS